MKSVFALRNKLIKRLCHNNSIFHVVAGKAEHRDVIDGPSDCYELTMGHSTDGM